MSLAQQLKESAQLMPRVTKCAGLRTDLAPVTAGITLWTIQNELIYVKYIFAVVREAPVGAAAPFLNYISAAAYGAPTTTAICALHAGLAAAPAGTVLQMTGVTIGILTSGAIQGIRSTGEATGIWANGDYVIMCPGVIQIVNATTAGAAGIIDWYMYFLPGGMNSRVAVRNP
jgi:hypothetical protein